MKTPVYFISDVHLKLEKSNEEAKRRNKLYGLFDKIVDTGGTCFFVGDLFDFYFEYPDLIPKAYIDFFIKIDEIMYFGKESMNWYFFIELHTFNT